MASLIRTAAMNGTLLLFIAPNGVKVLSKRSARSLSRSNDRSYQDIAARLRYSDDEQPSSTRINRSVPRIHAQQNNRDRSPDNYLSEPSEPLPRNTQFLRKNSFYSSIGCL